MPESADWYNAGFLMPWGSNVPQTRTPDAHFYTEVRYKGTKSVVVSPDYSEAAKFADLWLHPKQGTDAALALALGHVVLREFHLDREAEYFADYTRQYSDFPLLVTLVEQDGRLVPDRHLRAEGRPVFVNVTAAWCITCLVNERVALKSAAVAEAFKKKGVVVLKADWTNRNAVITEMLGTFGRNGVPLYLLYPPAVAGRPAGEPTVLPQILSEGTVVEAVNQL